MSAWFARGSSNPVTNPKEQSQADKPKHTDLKQESKDYEPNRRKKQLSQSAKSVPSNAWQTKESQVQTVSTNNAARSLSRSKDSLPVLPNLITPEMKKKIMEEFSDSDDSEEEDGVKADYNSMLDKTLQLYKKTMQSTSSEIVTDAREEESVETKFKNQIIDITNHRCLICLEKVKAFDSIWQCDQCCCILHLYCIQCWINNKSPSSQGTTVSNESFPNKMQTWLCPKCRQEYSKNDAPTRYYCYCKKVTNPPFDPWGTPHSCGQICGKNLGCGHTCTLLCHPNHCPPCPMTMKSSCHCGKVQSVKRCGQPKTSCGKVCGKLLACKQHKCEDICHQGDCSPCNKQSSQKCECGGITSMRPCYDLIFHCTKVCNKSLSCGKHVCKKICHGGNCGLCELTLPRRCPCGKSEYKLPCDQSTPTCGNTCDKLLSCGYHRCSEKCHKGECPPCMEIVEKRCRCKQSVKTMPCGKEYICEKKCTNERNCHRHQCKKKCCIGDCALCEEICDRKLTCGNHKCPSRCHVGLCMPCPVQVKIACACGDTFINVPCGAEKMTPPPKCHSLCRIPPTCHHSSRRHHRCHFGSCPDCRALCDVPHTPCGHPCPIKCHDTVPPYPWPEPQYYVPPKEVEKVMKNKKPASLLDIMRMEDPNNNNNNIESEYHQKKKRKIPVPPPMTADKVVCPACQVLVKRSCVGEHQIFDVVCSTNPIFPCRQECGNLLMCGNHKCTLRCHKVTVKRKIIQDEDGLDQVECDTMGVEESSVFDSCAPCNLDCQVPRDPPCKHSCPLPCHLNECPICIVGIKLSCHCGSIRKTIPCHQTQDAVLLSNLLICGQVCQKALPKCVHTCTDICHPGPCVVQCKKKIMAQCACGRIKDKIPCLEAQRLRDLKGKTTKDAKNILDCDAECERIKEELRLKKEKERLEKEQAQALLWQQNNNQPKKKQKKEAVVATKKGKDWSTFAIPIAVVILILALLVYYLMRY